MARPGISQIQVRHDEEPIRLFKSDFLEFFTHIHPAVVLLLFCPVLFYFLWRGVVELGAQSGLGMVAAMFGVGFLAWMLVEYVVHRHVTTSRRASFSSRSGSSSTESITSSRSARRGWSCLRS